MTISKSDTESSLKVGLQAKNLLTKKQYQELHKFLGGSYAFWSEHSKHVNHYFLDEDKKLKEKFAPGTTLRIREKAGENELQLKLIELDTKIIHAAKTILTLDECALLVGGGQLPEGDVQTILKEKRVSGKFEYQGESTTFRGEFKPKDFPGVIVCLDTTNYNVSGKLRDYEIEVKSSSRNDVDAVLDQILRANNISRITTPYKVERFLIAREKEKENQKII